MVQWLVFSAWVKGLYIQLQLHNRHIHAILSQIAASHPQQKIKIQKIYSPKYELFIWHDSKNI